MIPLSKVARRIKMEEPSGIGRRSTIRRPTREGKTDRRLQTTPGPKVARRLKRGGSAEKGHVACDPRARNSHRIDRRSEMNPEKKDARGLETSSGCGNKCLPRVKSGWSYKGEIDIFRDYFISRDSAKRTCRFGRFQLSSTKAHSEHTPSQ